MNRTEFNSYSFLEMENETLRARLIMKDKEIECLKAINISNERIIKLLEKEIKEKNENGAKDIHTK
jgi:hypothetical protein